MTYNRMIQLINVLNQHHAGFDLVQDGAELEEMYNTLFDFLNTNRRCANCPMDPVRPVYKDNKIYCGACGKRIPAKINAHYFHKCGRGINWLP